MQLAEALQNYLADNAQNWDWMIDYLKDHPAVCVPCFLNYTRWKEQIPAFKNGS